MSRAGRVRILKLERGKGYESISRDSLQDRRLSFKARGIMAYLKSMPNDWETNTEDIADASDKDGYEAVNNGIKELEAVGLFARLKRQGEGGRWIWLWVYSDDPGVIEHAKQEWVARYGGSTELRRGGNHKAKGRPDQQETTKTASDQDPVSGFSGHGKPVSGSPVHGLPPNKEIYSQIDPPQPPRPAGGLPDSLDPAVDVPTNDEPPLPDRCSCGKRVCRPCGFNTTRPSPADREAAVLARVEHEERGKQCGMCRRHGVDDNGWTFWRRVTPGTVNPVVPYTKCDHVTPHLVVMKLLDEAEERRERLVAEQLAERRRELAEDRERARRRSPGGGA